MYKFLKQDWWVLSLLGLAMLVGLVAPQLNSDNYRASILEYGAEGLTLEDDVIRFHLQVNEITNDFLEILTEEEEPNVNYPASEEECGETNVSTFCLASLLNEELTAFEIGLLVHKERFREKEDIGTITLKDAIKQQQVRGSLIESEIVSAVKAVDLTLAVYNEAQLAYPIHREFVRLVSNLEDYRTNLAKIRDSIEIYPSKFNDVLTIQCK